MPRYAVSRCALGALPADGYVMNRKDGVFLLVIAGTDTDGDILEHMVVVDAASKSIIECCEPQMLNFKWNVISKCVGRSQYRGAVAVRRLIRHDVGKRKRTDRRKRKKTKTKVEKKAHSGEKSRHLNIFRTLVDDNKAPTSLKQK